MSSEPKPETKPPPPPAGGEVESAPLSVGDEAFLPWLREDLEQLCHGEGKLPDEESEMFREFCRLLYTYLHLDFHDNLRTIDDLYAHFDPDRDTVPIRESEDIQKDEEEVVKCFRELAGRSNYYEISAEMIEHCLDAVTLIDLKTKVELNDFDHVVCFARGDIHSETIVRKLWKNRKLELDVLQRVVLLLKYKDEAYFTRTGRPRKEELKSDRIYTFYYKHVPKYDLEFLFPNVEIGMNLKDKLLLGVPAIGGSILVLTKLVPQILIISGLVVFFVAGPEAARRMGVSGDSVHQVLPAVTAFLGLTIALGGFAFKQWNAVRRKRFEFLKNVAEQLFYRKLANNQAVFNRLMSSAEAEESKEMVLALYQLWAGPEEGQSAAELDGRLEDWIERRLGAKVDFDIDGPIAYLTRLKGASSEYGDTVLLESADDGKLRAAPLPEAVALMRTLVTNSALGNRSPSAVET
jgi:hypothetical protein